jgi:hypothetical protein
MAEDAILPEWRNPKFNALGTIDMDINHPIHGWIPFTANPYDVERLGVSLYNAALELGGVGDLAAPPPEALQAAIVAVVQERLNVFAQSRGYDNILSAASYANSVVARFNSEGQRAASLRDATWAKLYEMLAEVQSGIRATPAGFSDIEGELPLLTWECE